MPVCRAQYYKRAYAARLAAAKAAQQQLIRRGGDNTHLVCVNAFFIYGGEFAVGYFRVPQNGVHLLHNGYKQIIYLRRFVRAFQPAPRFQPLRLRSELLPQRYIHSILIKRAHLFRCSRRILQGLAQLFKRTHNNAPGFLRRRGRAFAKGGFERAAAYPARKGIIFKNLRLLRRNAAQPRFNKGRHILP